MRPARRGDRVLAASVWAISWALALASLAVAWAAGLPAEPVPGVFLSQAPASMQARFDDIGVTVALVYGPVSALILARRPHPVGVILAVHAVGSGVAALGVQWGLLGQSVPGLPAWGFLAFAAGWGFVPGTFMTAALPLLVTREAVPRWQRAIVGLCAANALGAFALSLTHQGAAEPRNPLAIPVPGYQAVASDVYTALSFAAVAISILSCGVLVARWHRARGRARSGLAWLTLGHAFLTASYVSLVLPAGVVLPGWLVAFGMAAPVVGQVLYPAAILVVVLGQRLWGVELVVSRIVLWSLLTICGVTVYLVLVVAVPRFVPGAGRGLWLVVPVSIALAVQPLRRWLQHRVDTLVYGEAADPGALLARLGDRIGELEPGAQGLSQLCDALRRVLRLGQVSVRSSTDPGLAALSGTASGDRTVVSLHTAGRQVGELAVRARDGQRLDRRTLAVLDDLRGPLSAALRLLESNLVLTRSREALLAVRARERREIRRELHDGLGPALAGLGFGLAAVENLLAEHPDAALELLDELAEDLARRERQVDDLATSTHSPLDGTSLADAVEHLARRFTSARLRVRTTLADTASLSAPVRDGIYLIAAEAIANAARHADPTRIDVVVRTDGRAVELTVADDGPGMASGARTGVGLRSMRERAEELGGLLETVTGPQGTTVRARLVDPVPDWDPEPA